MAVSRPQRAPFTPSCCIPLRVLVFYEKGGTIAALRKTMSGGCLTGWSPMLESAMANEPVYKVIFQNGNQVFEVFARQIYQSDMWGFIEVEEFVFGERSQILVDPSEEKLKNEFSGVKRSYIPIQAVIRIDEVEKEGSSKVSALASGEDNVASFPFAGMPPEQKESD